MNFMIIFGLIFFAVGAAMLVIAIIQGNKAKAAEAWPTIPGVVLSSGLQEHRHYDSEDQSTSINYEPQVIYQYSIMGQNYQSNHIAFGSMQYDYNTAFKKIQPYPQGAPVTVHYNPTDPSNAVLETKSAGGVLLYILGGIFILIGIGVPIGSFLTK